MTKKLRICILNNYNLIHYKDTWEIQKKLFQERINNANLADVLMLVEHYPIYTLGTGSNIDFLKFNIETSDIKVYKTERGGEVTYHCPGQIVGYPILNLSYYQQDLHWYLRQLEEVIIQLLQKYNLDAYRITGLTGVWVNNHKIAAIGIKVKRWITMHGFSINVNPDLRGFSQIIPCGITDKPVGSMAQFLPNITVNEVKIDLIDIFAQVFEVEIINNFDSFMT